LADSLQRLILLAAAMGLPAQAAGFSHKQHLEIGLACTTCHAGASASTKASDNLLPSPNVCLECHADGRQVRATPAPMLAARFNHALHLKMGNLAPVIAAAIDKGSYLSKPGDIRAHLNGKNPCEACHRGLDQADSVSAANFPVMADCLVCHNKIDPPFSCEKCHVDGPRLRPASHTPDFIDTHSSGRLRLDKPSCAVCHGRRFTCQGCH
jgi:predicted CXXCH cytochrome family protein